MVTSVPNGIITFPMFGDGFSVTAPSVFSIFGVSIHWYGLIIAIGFVLAYLYVDRFRRRLGIGSNDYLDYLLCAIPAGVIGARLYYVIFNFSLYRDNFWDVFKIWEGGLAIYGGVIGAAIALIICAKVKKMPASVPLDAAAPGLLIGQAVGRWGNFMNREAFGGETDIFCRMGLTDASGSTIYVHPTFLYESLWNLAGLLFIHFFFKNHRRKYDGQVFLFYVAWYGLGRMLIEGLRTDSLYLFGSGLRVSQLLAAITLLAAAIILCYNGSKKHPPEKLYVNTLPKTGEKNPYTAG